MLQAYRLTLVLAAVAASLGAVPPEPSSWLAVTGWTVGSGSATSSALHEPPTIYAPAPTAASALTRLPAAELDARFFALEMNFRARRSVLSIAGAPISIETEPTWLRAEFRPGMEELARWGSPRASAWLLRHFDSDESAALVVERKSELYRQVLERFAGAEWIDSNELDVTTALLLDALVLGPRLTGEFAELVLEANPGRFQRRATVRRASARALLGEGLADSGRRKLAADLWRAELQVASGSPFESYARNELWRLENFWIGDRPPGFEASDVDGNELDLRDFSGKVLVVAFFRLGSRADSAWALRVRDLAQANEQHPFAVLGIELGTNESAFRRLVEEHELRFPCVYELDEPGRVASAWRLNEVPRALVFDGSGRLRLVDLDGAALESTVATLLQELDGSPSGAHGRTSTRR